MNEATTNTPPPSANLSVDGLAARLLASQMHSSAGTPAAATQPPQPAATTPAVQPTEEGAEESTETPTVPPETPAAPEPDGEVPGETPETEGETPANPEPTEEDHRTEAETEAQLPLPKAVQSLRDRVHTVCDQRDAARDDAASARQEAEALKQQNQQLAEQVTQLREGTPANLRSIDRFSGHPAVKDIDARLSNVDSTLAWCDENPEGGEITEGEGKVRTFSAAEVRKIQRTVERDRADLVAERVNKVGKIEDAENVRRQAADTKARALYPWLTQKQSPEFQVAVQIGREIPGLVNHPEFILHIGDLVTQRLAREKKGVTRPATPAKRPNAANPPNVTTQPAGAPRVTNPLETQVQAAQEEYRKTPTLAVYQKLTRLKSQLAVQTPGRAAA